MQKARSLAVSVLLTVGSCFAFTGSSVASLSDGLVAHWKLDDGTDSPTAADSSGNGYTGTLTDMDLATDWVAGEIGGALEFDGANDCVDCGNPPLVGNVDEYTLAAWVRPDDTATDVTYGDPILAKESGGDGFQLTWHYTGGVGRFGLVSNPVANMLWSASDKSNGVWYHVAAVFEQGTGEARIYVDGELDGSGSRTYVKNTTDTLYVGSYGGARFLKATVDDVRVYDRALAPAEIRDLYATGVWWDSAWPNRIKITVDSTTVAADQTGFPVLFLLSRIDAAHPFWATVKDGGGDLVVTAADEVTRLPLEVVSCETAAKTGEIWFKGDLSATEDTIFYLYYGSSSASQPAPSDVYGSENVWDVNYVAVYHMEEDPSGSPPQMKDSTQYANNGTSGGTMTFTDRVNEKVGKGTDFDGIDDFINLGNTTSLQIGTDKLTLSAWAKPMLDGDNQGRRLISKRADNPTYGDAYGLYYYTGNKWRFRSYTGGAAGNEMTTDAFFTTGDWQYVVATYDGATMKVYVNGSQDTSTVGGSGPIGDALYPTCISHRWQGNRWFPGIIDEARISDVHRDGNYILTQHDMMNDQATFWPTIGGEEDRPEWSLSVTALTADDPDDLDNSYGLGDTITIGFDADTNQSMNGLTKTGDEMDLLFTLSGGHEFGDAGDSYLLSWSDPRTLVLAVQAVSLSDVQIGDTLALLLAADIKDAAETMPACTDTSPAMTGDWGVPAPDIVSAVCDDPDDGDKVLSADDTLTVTFDMATNAPAVTTKLALDSLLTFANPLGSDYTGAWSVGDTVLTITVQNAAGGTFAPGDLVTVKASGDLRNTVGTSPASTASEVTTGDWGLEPPLILGAVCDDPDNLDNKLSAGDTLTITFDVATNAPAVATKGNLDALLTFANPLGSGYTGAWSAGDTVITITIQDASSGSFTPGDSVTVRASGDLRNAAGTSAASTSSAASTGDWGTLPLPGAFGLSAPSNGLTDVSLTPVLDWGDSSDVVTYALLVDDDSGFLSAEVDEPALASSTHTVGAGDLSLGVTYYWRVTAVNGSGSMPATGNDFSFTTTTVVPPSVTITSPPDEAEDVDPEAVISVTFSVAMNEGVTQGAFSIVPDAAGSFSWSGNTMTYDPNSRLAENTTFTVTIGTGATDLGGTPLAQAYGFSFATRTLSRGWLGGGCAAGASGGWLAFFVLIPHLALRRRKRQD